MRFNELDIEKYIGSGDHWKAFESGEQTKQMIIHLAEILDQLEPQGEDNLHTIWAKVPRPTFRQYYEYHYGYDLPYHNTNDKTIKRIPQCPPEKEKAIMDALRHFGMIS